MKPHIKPWPAGGWVCWVKGFEHMGWVESTPRLAYLGWKSSTFLQQMRDTTSVRKQLAQRAGAPR